MKMCVLASVLALALLMGTGTANAEPGDIVRCSTDAAGAEGDDYSLACSISSDGRYVAFESRASNLVQGDNNGVRDIFRKDLETGEIVLCSTSSTGSQSNDGSYFSAISSDGRYVAFMSFASNLVSGDTNGFLDVFRKDLETGTIVRCSTDSVGVQGNNLSAGPSISCDGRYVTFGSSASNLVPGDTNGFFDVFRKDLETGTIIRCSTDSAGVQGNNSSSGPSTSCDGRYVTFGSSASNLVPGDTNGFSDVFRKDLETGTVVRCSIDSAGVQGNNSSSAPSISCDGRYVAFESYASNLVPGDTNGVRDIFRKDLETGEIVRCSTNSAGGQGNYSSDKPSISSEGRYVAFGSSATSLVSWDTNGTYSDVFRKDLQTGAIAICSTDCEGAQGHLVSYDPSISSDGAYVAFNSNVSTLVPGDNNEFSDIFRKEPVDEAPLSLSVFSIVPASTSRLDFFVDVEITGTGFYPDSQVRLEKSASSILNINEVPVSETRLTGNALFFGAEPGIYDVVVTNPDGSEARLPEAFTVTSDCGQGSGTALLMLGLTLGLLYLAGSSSVRKRRKA